MNYFSRSSGLLTLCAVCIALNTLHTCAAGMPGHGMVVSADSIASAAGVEVLRQGGNAIDAAVAVGFTLAVTFPEAGNIGGGGFMLIRLADGTTEMVDFREKAPLRATATMFQDSLGNVVSQKSTLGPLAAGVPGTVAGLLTALDRFGVMKRTNVLEPAITIARQGFQVDKRLENSLQGQLERLALFPSSLKIFTDDGRPYCAGELFRQPELASTLEAIRDSGRDGFYAGWVADSIVALMKAEGGIVTHEDLARYTAAERTPLKGSYRGYEIVTAAPPSAGGIVLLEMLNILEGFDLRTKGFHSSSALHLFSAAAQVGFADRSRYLGDPDVVEVPVQQLISKEYASVRRAGIDTTFAIPSSRIAPGSFSSDAGHETTHYCVADTYGNVVSTTFTINSLYGCKASVGGAGFVLNNEMDDFTALIGGHDQAGLVGGMANEIQSGKRMVSSMTPTIVVKDGAPVLAVGARGSGRIISAVAQVIINIVDFGQSATEAVNGARIHYQWMPDTLDYESGIPVATLDGLKAMGYSLKEMPFATGRVEALWLDPRTHIPVGAPDHREEGVAIGY